MAGVCERDGKTMTITIGDVDCNSINFTRFINMCNINIRSELAQEIHEVFETSETVTITVTQDKACD